MNHTHYGGFWRRMIAFLIDKFVLSLISMILVFIASLFLGLGFPFDLSINISEVITGTFILSYYGTTIFLNMVYFTYFHGTTGQTPGKKIIGLKVIQKTGDEMTLGLAFLRWVGYIVSGLVFNLGFLWVAFDRKKQGWHDKIASTYVINLRENSTDDKTD
ncbi:MAG: RDD family protein [Deltaproteobacteria bacterium]|nr:RDD family protein [Deltaproteobacteria bacterium]